MNDIIICPHCKKDVPLTDALKHQLEDEYQASLDKLKKENETERQKLIEKAKQRIEEEKKKALQESEQKLRQQIKQELELKLQDQTNESKELKIQNKQLQEQILETNKLIRQLRNEKETAQIELEKKIAKEQERIRTEEQKRLAEQYHLKELEGQKKLQDALRANEELKRKLEQGSQQSQGEVAELEFESILRQEFLFDEIKEVPKGISGADLIQIVKNNYGKQVGTILWEFKRTKTWSKQWIQKLKQDQREIKAEIAVLISQILPEDIKHVGFRDGIWIGNFDVIVGIAYALRARLLEVDAVKQSSKGKQSKMEVLYEYLSGTEFKQRVESIVESFSSIQNDIETEKRWFQKKWAKQEKMIRRVIDNTIGMHGDLQSIMGSSLQEMKQLDGLSADEPSQNELKGGKTGLF